MSESRRRLRRSRPMQRPFQDPAHHDGGKRRNSYLIRTDLEPHPAALPDQLLRFLPRALPLLLSLAFRNLALLLLQLAEVRKFVSDGAVYGERICAIIDERALGGDLELVGGELGEVGWDVETGRDESAVCVDAG